MIEKCDHCKDCHCVMARKGRDKVRVVIDNNTEKIRYITEQSISECRDIMDVDDAPIEGKKDVILGC